MADVGDVDARQRAWNLFPPTAQRSGDGAEHGRGVAGQGNPKPGDARGAAAGGRPSGSSGRGTIGSPGTGASEHPQGDAKCSGEKRVVSFEKPSNSALLLPGLTKMGWIVGICQNQRLDGHFVANDLRS